MTLGHRKTSRLVHTLILFHSRLTIPVSRNFVLLFTLAPIVNYRKVQSYGLSEPFSRALIPHRPGITGNSMQQALLEFSLFIPSGSMPNRFFNRSNSLVSFLRFSWIPFFFSFLFSFSLSSFSFLPLMGKPFSSYFES